MEEKDEVRRGKHVKVKMSKEEAKKEAKRIKALSNKYHLPSQKQQKKK